MVRKTRCLDPGEKETAWNELFLTQEGSYIRRKRLRKVKHPDPGETKNFFSYEDRNLDPGEDKIADSSEPYQPGKLVLISQNSSPSLSNGQDIWSKQNNEKNYSSETSIDWVLNKPIHLESNLTNSIQIWRRNALTLEFKFQCNLSQSSWILIHSTGTRCKSSIRGPISLSHIAF